MNLKFTLIELLVAISILGILMSILMPSVHKAKAKAMQAVCVSNLSNIGKASQLYSSNDCQSLPVYMQGTHSRRGHDKVGLERALGTYLGSKTPSQWFQATGNPVFMCPSAPVKFDYENFQYVWIADDNAGARTNTYEGLYYHYQRTSLNPNQNSPDNRLLNRAQYENPASHPYQWCSRRQAPVWTELDDSGWNNTLVGASWHSRENFGPGQLFFWMAMYVL